MQNNNDNNMAGENTPAENMPAESMPVNNRNEQKKTHNRQHNQGRQNDHGNRGGGRRRNYEQYADRLGLQPHYVQWGITGFMVIAASMLFYYLLFNTKNITSGISRFLDILRPIIYGLVLAYLMAPAVNAIEGKILLPLWKKMGKDPDTAKAKKSHRSISIVATVFLLIILLYLFFASIIPQLMQSLQTLVVQLPVYTENLQNFIDKFFMRNPQLRTYLNALLNNYNNEIAEALTSKLMPKLNELLTKVSGNLLSSVASVLSTLWNLVIGLIVSIYLLASKENFIAQAKKLIYSVMSRERANQTIKNAQFVKHTFADYISGKLIDSLIIGLICFIGTTCLVLPYPLLISVIVGVTNIIPFFGPYLGAIPSALIILMIDPKKALVFVIFILILQQFDGNFLGPKILGDSTGLSSFWIIFSITLMGGYFSILGMAIGVPIFAIIYAAVRALMNRSLRNKKLSTNTSDYNGLQNIDEDLGYHYRILVSAEQKKKERNRRRKKGLEADDDHSDTP